MEERKVIPFDMVTDRAIHLIKTSIYECYTDYSTVIRNVHNNNLTPLDAYIKEAASNNNLANSNAINIINILSEDAVKNSPAITKYIRVYNSDIVPAVKDLNSLKSIVESCGLSDDHKKDIINTINTVTECNRLLENHNKISSIFNLENIDRKCKYKDVTDVTESVCEMIDTYNMSLKKKLNIALEEALYLYYKSGVDVDKSLVVESAVEYFLSRNEYLTDTEFLGIRKVLDNNKFIAQEDTNLVSYLYNEAVLFSDKFDILTESSKDLRVKKLLNAAKEAKTVKAAKGVVNSIFKLIVSEFVFAATITFAEVSLLIVAMFAMIAAIGHTGNEILHHITGKTEELEKKRKSATAEDIKRLEQVVGELNKEIQKAKESSDPVKESANILDQAIDKIAFDPGVFVIHEPDPEDDDGFAFNMINDILKSGKSVVKESKEFADSDDVADLIKKYKADQNKSQGKLKATITRIFTKSPAQIIDETPKIFEFIRVFGIFATAAIPTAIGPSIALVTFMADRFITMTLKRKDADRVCDYFKKEKNKMEKKASSLKDGDKKDATEEYIQCLDKCIDKLEDYRDSLYSSKELDRRNGYDEAANVNFSQKITTDEYMNTCHKTVCHNLDIAIQLLRNEILRRCSGISLEEYDISATNDPAGKVFENMPVDTLVKQYCTPDGIINIPLFSIKESVLGMNVTKDLYITITDICSYVNQYLSDKCMVNNYNENGNIYIIFNYLQAICIGDLEPYCATENLKESAAYISFFGEAVDEIEKRSPSTIVSELCKNIDTLVYEYDLNEIISALEESNLIYDDFVEIIKDYRDTNTNPIIEYNIARALGSVNKAPMYSVTESLLATVDSISLLEEVINEANKVKNNKAPKGNILKNAKENIATKASNAKTAINNKKEMLGSKASEVSDKAKMATHKAANTAALSAEVGKKKIASIATKEKEVSRNVDISLSRLKKSIDNALTSDRREAIIKGSIIPSFSRIIKFAVAGGIMFKINPGIAAITSLGALIRSKSLNKKERYLLMDEIETELNVVEKELEIAERDGDMKKYRNLLTFKKKLQRELQRIRYDMRIHPKPAALDPED